MGKLQSEFSKSSNAMMDQAATLGMVTQKVQSLAVPDDFKGNPSEFQRRSREGLQRLLGDEYMLAIQNEQHFDLKGTLTKLPKTETPTTLNQRAAVIENREFTDGEKIDPQRRLRNATMDTQQAYLEQAAASIKQEYLKTGTVAANGPITDLAKGAYAKGLTPSDVANYATLTEGVAIPKETLDKVAATPKPKEEPKQSTPAPIPAASPAASTPTPP